jgi:thiamine pyrophosphate-dependent acetolactate synthase large subunit-like protein
VSGAPLDRRQVVARLLEDRGDRLVVGGLGSPAWDVSAAGDHPLNFPLWGAMGGAAMIGLGLALAQPDRRVLVVTGDGEMLMGLGSLAAIGVQRPGNLALVVLDNERYGETGMQPTHTAHGVDLAGIAAHCGLARTGTVRTAHDLAIASEAIRNGAGPLFYAIKIGADPAPLVLPPKDGAFLKDRFRAALLGSEAIR